MLKRNTVHYVQITVVIAITTPVLTVSIRMHKHRNSPSL